MFKSWAFNEEHKQYTGVMQVVDNLPPGFYTLSTDQFERPLACQLEVKKDRLLPFSGGVVESVLKEVDQFWGAADRYKELGVSHKRGLLLYGEPGCGKTAIVQMVMQDTIKREGIVFDLTGDPEEFRDAIAMARQIENGRPVVALIEDIERVCRTYEEDLLAIMDGAAAISDGILFLATTNFLSKVPDRIAKRPSRIDTLIEVAPPDGNTRRQYLNFLGVTDEQLVELTNGLSLAHIKELVIGTKIYGRTAEQVLAQFKINDEEEGE